MYRIALKMLMGDRAKYLLLVSALSFSALLITHQSSIFCGLLRWSTAMLRNTQAPLWIVDPLVEQPGEVLPLLDTDLTRVRSIDGVKWAVPLFFSIHQARLEGGAFKPIQLIGIDSATLIGAPPRIVQGNLQDLWQEGAVVIDQVAIEHFSVGKDRPIGVGDYFDINDHEVRVVAVCKADRSFFGYPYVYTTFDRAKQIIPLKRKNLAFVLAAPNDGALLETVAHRIERETGLKAFTEEKFAKSTIEWVFKNTGIPVSFGITILMGFLVGIAVSGQTFYSFILENIKHLAALKAMGATNALLCRMLILQALLVGVIGFGIGVGVSSIFGHIAYAKDAVPFFMATQALVGTFIVIFTICLFSALLGILRIKKLDASEVFRG